MDQSNNNNNKADNNNSSTPTHGNKILSPSYISSLVELLEDEKKDIEGKAEAIDVLASLDYNKFKSLILQSLINSIQPQNYLYITSKILQTAAKWNLISSSTSSTSTNDSDKEKEKEKEREKDDSYSQKEKEFLEKIRPALEEILMKWVDMNASISNTIIYIYIFRYIDPFPFIPFNIYIYNTRVYIYTYS